MYFNQFKYSYKIMTIHGCKGLEFENVLIFTADYLGMFQINGKTKKEIEQAHNLHYVSCTRAREFLFVIHNKKLSKNNKLYWNDSYKEKIEEFYDVS